MVRLLRSISWLIGLVIVLVILAGLFIYSGLYNVSAMHPDNAFFEEILDTTKDRSVKRHAAGIQVPALNDPAMVRAGMGHYSRRCAGCHGAPGVPVRDIGRGLRPRPPELMEEVSEWKPNELFWLTKNGIRMTGMPAWGVTRSDEEIWAIVAFMQTLPTLKPEDYARMTSQ